jgi:hypothetical protein
MIDLCDHCRKAKNGCPIFPPLRTTNSCIEYSSKQNILPEAFNKLVIQNISLRNEKQKIRNKKEN